MAAAAARYEEWLSESGVDELSAALADPAGVREERRAALRAFLELPIEPDPTFRGYSNIAGADLTHLDRNAVGPAVARPAAEANTLQVIHDASGTRITLPPSLRSAGVTAEALPEVWQHPPTGPLRPLAGVVSEDKLTAFARAVVNRAVRITVPDRCALPVRVQDISVLSQPRQSLSVQRTISAGASSRVLVSEELYSTSEAAEVGQRLYASTVDVRGGEESSVHYLTVHAPDPLAVSLYQRRATVGTRGRHAWLWAGFGGMRTRLRSASELPGNGSEVDDLQTFYGRGEQAYDSSVRITHIGTDTHGQSITRGVFQDKARGVSRGVVRIEPDARKTLSYLSEHAMLLSRGARSDTIPILEILCRDVKATHSSSVAPVDPEKVFYLGSRGIDERSAIRMIGEGFLSHVLERAAIANLREILYPILQARWEDRPVLWSAADGIPALPALSVNDASASDEWRFDAKLR